MATAVAASPAGKNLRRRLRLGERIIEGWIFLAGLLTIIVLIGVLVVLLREGLPVFATTPPWEFLFGTKWYPVSDPPTFGILPFFVSTLVVTVIATIVAVPIGIGCAAYLAEVASSKVRETAKPIIELLAGIPSVMMGFIGLILLAPLVQSAFNLNTGLCGLTAAIMLSLMSLPIIVSVSEDALHAVPDEFKSAAYALGATKWETIWHVCIPAALSGITAAIMLGIGRAIGETMTVLMVAGGALAVPVSPTDPMTTMTAAIASGIGNAVRGGLQYQALFAIGLILFVMTLAVNLIAERVLERQKRKFAR
jgi:phosphate transport system permease protein